MQDDDRLDKLLEMLEKKAPGPTKPLVVKKSGGVGGARPASAGATRLVSGELPG